MIAHSTTSQPIMHWGEFAALATAVCWSLTAVFFSFSGRLIGSDVVNRSRLIIALLALSITHLIIEGTLFPWGTAPYRLLWFAISAILGLVLGDTFLFKAYVLVGPRISMLLMSSVPIYSTLFGWLLFGELVSGLELAGIILTVSGIAWVVTERRAESSQVQNKDYRKGIFFGLLGALGQVLNLVTARYGLEGGYPTISAAVIRIAIALIILWSIAALRGQVQYTLRMWRNRQAMQALLAGSISGPFLGIWFSMIAIQNARLGIASTLMALPPILLIPVDRIVYKRRVSWRSVIGTLIAIIGVTLIVLP